MPIAEFVLSSLGELIDRVTPPEPDPVTGRRRDSGIYRGSSDARRPLLTSLDRLGGTDPPHTKRDLEAHILRSFIRYSRPHTSGSTTDEWELLVSAQHHGAPTRLLDWTYSPLIAAHFATVGRPDDRPEDADRVVWRLDWKLVHRAFQLPELALLIDDFARRFGAGEWMSPWQLFQRPSEAPPFASMIDPPSLDARIVEQAAVFTLSSDTTCSFEVFLDRNGLSSALTRFIIPSNAAQRFRDQLDIVGMDERRLFPDLDGVADELRRYYS